MAGLEKILEGIRAESRESVDAIMKKAQAEADEVIAKAQAEADSETQKVLSRAQLQADDLIARADSAAQLKTRRAILETKQELINEVLGKAKEAFLSLSDNEYFEMILKLISANALPGEGEICFSRKDFDRLPKDFAAKLVACLPQGAKLNVSADDAKIDGGFLLKYDGLEQNLSVEEIFEEKKDAMTDIVGKVLFS